MGGGGGGGIYGGGNGGFAGGGGGSGNGSGYAHTGGNGGFGGGGGGSNGTPGTGGFGAGSGSLAGGGGGGLGAGGDIFVQQGGTLTVIGGTLMDATETGGTGANGAGNGSAYGDIFIQGTMVVTPTHTVSTVFEGLQTVTTLTIGDSIADERGISGSGTTGKLVVSGGGTLTLTGASTYVGGTQIDAGNTLSITANNNIGGSAGALILNGGTLTTTGGYTFTHNIQVTAAGGTFDISSGTIADTGAISGSGTFTLSGAGTLQLGLGQLAGLTGTLNLSSAHLSLTTGGTFDDSISVGGSSLLKIANGATVTDTALISGGGNLGIDGGGTFVLGHANTYGSTTIYSGTVWLATAGAAGTGNISFTTGLPGTLKIDDAALTGNALTNSISNFNPGQSIDLTGLHYNTQNTSLNTVSLSGNTLSISNGTVTDTLTVNGLDGGARFQLSQDANGGTVVQLVSTRVFNVSNVTELNAAILQMDSGGQNAAPNANYTINITASFSLSSELYALNLLSGSSVTINGSDGHGGTHTIDGLNAQRGFFVYAGNVNLENLTIQNTVAAGGGIIQGGGGGGAGLGGALFVSANGSATIDNVVFHNSVAIGGNGGTGSTASNANIDGFGGGGGMGGQGGNSSGGGIGLHAQGANSAAFQNGAAGIVPGAAGGGKGVDGYLIPFGGGTMLYWYGGTGGANGGGGGAGGFFGNNNRAHGTGGGVGGGNAIDGGNGGYGGGGLGAGGTIFVQQGGSLTVKGGSLSNDSGFSAVKGGTNGIGQASGSGFGSGIFIQGNNNLSFTPASGQTLTVANDIADQSGNGGTGANAGIGGLAISGGGTVILGGNNTYTGNTTVSGAGTRVSISANVNLGAVTNVLKLGDGTGISFTDGFTQTRNITVAGDPVFNVAAGETVTQSGVISDGTTPGDVEVTGGGRLVLSAHNTYSGGTVIKGSILELAASGAAGTGAIAFTDGSTEKLVLDAAAFSGTSFGTSITGLSGGDTIDFGNIAYDATATLSYANGVLLVKSGSGTTLASLNLSFGAGASAGSLLLGSDGSASPHLEIRSQASIASVTADTTDHLTTLNAGKVVTITVNFSNTVSVTGAPELLLNDGKAATYLSGSGSQVLVFCYTVQDGDSTSDLQVQSLSLNGGTIRDPGGQDADVTHAATDLHLVIDAIAPTVSVAASSTALLAGQTSTVTFTFSEAVTGFALTDTTVSGGALSNLVHVGVNAAHQDIYTATFTSDVTNAEAGSVQVNASSYTDSAGNAGAASSAISFTGDTKAPTVAVAADHTTLVAGDSAVVTFTFSEAVSGFGLDDVTVQGGSLGNLTHVGIDGAGHDVYTATFTPDVTNTEAGSVQINASSYSDTAGNSGSSSNTISFIGDTKAPTVSVSADHGTLLAGQTAVVTFTFSEAVAGFGLGDVSVSGGALGSLVHVGVNGAGQDIYTATFTPDVTNAEAGSVQVNASSYSDTAGNAGAASNAINFTGDTLAPTVSVTLNPDTVLAGDLSVATFTFSETVSGFALGDITVHGGALSNLVHVGLNGAGQDVYTATFTPDVSDTETGSVKVNASGYSDVAGNSGAASNTATIGGDTLAPTVSIAADRNALLAGQTALVTFTFSEQIASFALGDVTVHGGALGNLVHVGVNASGQDVYTAIFTPDESNTEAGSVQVTASGYTDVAGNSGAASNAINFTGDTRAPTVSVTVSPSTVLSGQTSAVTFTFSEEVAGFALGDTAVAGGLLSNLIHVGLNGSGQDVYTATFTPDINDVVAGSVRVTAASYADVSGNTGAASNTATIGGDTHPPTVSVAADHTLLHAGDAALMTFTFSEAVAGFGLGDVTVHGGLLGSLVHVGVNGAGHDIYTATFTADVTDHLSADLSVAGASYTDIAGNAGGASNAVSFTGDTKAPSAPTLALHRDTGVSSADHITSNPLIDYTKFDAADTLRYKADGASGFSTAAPVFTTDGMHSVTVQEVDAAGNVSASSSLTFTLDTTAPHLTGITATPSGGVAAPGSLVQLTVGFNEAVHVNGGTPSLTLNDGGTAIYDAAATALLGDSSKLVFDYIVSSTDRAGSLAVTGFAANGADVVDLVGNAASLSAVSAVFDALHINETIVPAYTLGAITRPELHLDLGGRIIMDATASAFAGHYGMQYLFLGLPAGTPHQTVPDFHL
ncbi:Ig-like domain-containing protein [Bradyrhizobium brasilense]|uniref:Ig-like domain-containing protein n=1 Tax=Bradyrhizobium brasilense TaxID=1419277 RepID=UPI001456E929|nr:Ig-like domain-containing protein [Bradyrhizobium brasilense]